MHKYMYMRYLKPTLMQRLPCQALKHVGRTSPRHSKTNTTVVYKLHLRQTSLTLLVQNISTHGQQYQTASATIQISVVVRLAFHVGGWAIGLCPTPIVAYPSPWKHCHFITTVLLCTANTEIQDSHLVEGSTSEPTETGAVLAVGVVGTA